MSPCVKGYQMPVRHGQCGGFRGQASDKPQGRKPRAGSGAAVAAVELWGFEGRGQWAKAEVPRLPERRRCMRMHWRGVPVR